MMGKWISIVTTIVLLLPAFAFSQNASIEGEVVSAENSEPLPGVNIFIEEVDRGVATDEEGQFIIQGLEDGSYTLRVTFVGYETVNQNVTITDGQDQFLEVVLQSSVLDMEELVVTGVTSGTQKQKLGFTVNDISEEELSKVPSINAVSAVQGKVPGLKISSSSGAPGSDVDIQLRGATTIFGSGNPLIIIDGVLTDGGLSDINAEDIQSIEVVKGAAASSMYGSRAANGVINVITKRGSGLAEGSTSISFRTEVGQSFVGHVPEKTTTTNYVVEGGEVQYDQPEADGVYDNPYPELTDPKDQLFRPGTYNTNYLSFSGNSSSGNTSLYSSIQHSLEKGVVKLTDGSQRLNFRLNLDHKFNDDFQISATNLYTQSAIDQRANGIWDMFYYADPDVDYFQQNDDGSPYKVDPNNLGNHQNPLYAINNTISEQDKFRFLGNYELNYNPADFAEFKLAYGLNRSNSKSRGLTPKGKLQVNQPPSTGNISLFSGNSFSQNLQADALFRHSFSSDIDARVNLQYLYESDEFSSESSSGQNLAVKGMDISSLELASENINIGSYNSLVVANNFTSSLFLDIKNKYIIDALIRRDGVSLFGTNERWQTFYRIAGAWRLSEEFEIPSVDELKIRASYGTAGLRPTYEARYEVVGVSDGSITSPVTLGNQDLKPSFSHELEFGVDAEFLDRFSLTANYSRSINTDQILNVPVSASTGFITQWQNAGKLKSETYEASLNANLIQDKDWSWNVNLLWDRTRQEVLSLNRENYSIVSGGIFRIEEGGVFGTLYGHKWATSLDEVSNQVPDGETLEDYFAINSDGYIVENSVLGTPDEIPHKIVDDQGNPINTKIGDVNPDFTLNFGSNLDYKKFNLYMLWSWQQGGDMYNHMRRYMLVHNVGKELDQSGKPEDEKKGAQYYNELTSWNNSHFVEDATFLKLRELSLGYSISNEKLSSFGIQNINISVIGRNLLTVTDYTGFDPELGHTEEGLSSNVLKFDLSSYPTYRTISASVGITF